MSVEDITAFFAAIIQKLTPGRKAKNTCSTQKKRAVEEQPASIWEECFPDETCLFDEMTAKEIDEFKAEKAAMQERERKLGRSSYRPQPEGMTADDLVERIKKRADAGETFAD